MSTTYGDGRKRARRPPVPCYRVIIPENLEHSELHLQLKKLLGEQGVVVMVRRDHRQGLDVVNSLESATSQE